MGKMSDQAFPRFSLVSAPPNLSLGVSKIQTHGSMVVRIHRLPFHGKPRLTSGKPLIQAFPALSRIPAHIDRWLSIRTGSWPNGGSIHGKNPNGIRIPGMKDDRKSDISDFFQACLNQCEPKHLLASPSDKSRNDFAEKGGQASRGEV